MEQKTTVKIVEVDPILRINNDEKPIAPHLQLLSIQDVCRRLNVGYWMVYKLISERKLKSITIGKRRLITVQALQDFINQSEGDNNG